ncbi:helix-turn-helix domain-containing protein [Melissospora conviva]|uniref:helix-turn-helix domain-containing protein n=1 Tax=Melissospora conviva TaxID=3388432 RepID=UPI003C23B57E
MSTYTADQITRIGGREWTGANGAHRVYINEDVWTALVGLEIDRYKSGNIQHAELNGEKISNARAARLAAIKVYWQDGRILITRDAELADDIRAAIAKAVADSEPAADDQDDDTGAENTAGRTVAALRSAGRTVREIAEMVGVSATTIYRWVHGVCRPRPVNAAALAALA